MRSPWSAKTTPSSRPPVAWPTCAAAADAVSMRQLLNHTSGIPDNTLEPLVIRYAFPHGRARAWTPRELVVLIADEPPDSRRR
jgi:CubicO group peptidase (beta-lactamase class C family)